MLIYTEPRRHHRSVLKQTHALHNITMMRIAAPAAVLHHSTIRSITQQSTKPRGRPPNTPSRSQRGSATRSAALMTPDQESVNDGALKSVEEALAAACQVLGRPFGDHEQALAARLRDNWYTHATDLVALDAVCTSVGTTTVVHHFALFKLSYDNSGASCSTASSIAPAQTYSAAAGCFQHHSSNRSI